MPLDIPSAVPTAALLNDPVICCVPRGRSQLAVQSVTRPVSTQNTALSETISLTVPARAWGGIGPLLGFGSAFSATISCHLAHSFCILRRKLSSDFAATPPTRAATDG